MKTEKTIPLADLVDLATEALLEQGLNFKMEELNLSVYKRAIIKKMKIMIATMERGSLPRGVFAVPIEKRERERERESFEREVLGGGGGATE